MSKRTKYGFTLVELLVVVAVILLLAGMLFRIGNLVSDRAQRARAISDMQAIANALEEYYAAHGIYPPTRGMRYTYPDPGLQPPQMRDNDDVNADGFQYGLASYLYFRGEHDPARDQSDRDQSDEAIKNRWQSYLAELSLARGAVPRSNVLTDVTLVYSNLTMTVVNPWGGSYNYESTRPYLSYRLWTGVPGSDEDLSVSSAGQ